MKNSKLYSILEKLDKIEQNRLRKYLESPYFNSDYTLLQLFEIFMREINGEKHLNLEKEDIWKKLDLKKDYDDVRFRKYCSDLLKLVEGYLTQEVFQENELLKASLHIQAVGRKKLEKLYNGAMRKARRTSQKFPHRSATYYYYQHEIEKNYYEMAQHELQRASKSNIEEISKQLDVFYLSEKLRWYCEVISRQSVKAHEYKLMLIDDIISQIESTEYKKNPSIAIYYQIFQISDDADNIDNYYELKHLLAEHGLIFPQNEALSIYYSAINYCIQKINEGNQKFLNELFDLYNDLIEKEIIFVDDELSPWDFRNIVVIALRLGKFDWTENFILNYNIKIPETYRENAVSFNMATLYFYKKEFHNVIRLLHTVEYEDPSYNLNSKAMLLATYFEMDEIEPLYSLFESFRVYLNRKKDIPEDKKRLYKNLIKFTRKLTRIIPGDKKSIDKLRQEIDATKNIASAGWLKEKITELEG